MLWTLCVILLILRLPGLVSGYRIGGFIHILLVVAIVVVLIRVIRGREYCSDWTLAGEGEVLGREVVSRPRKILQSV